MRALRMAVAQTRLSDRELLAVRAFQPPPPDGEPRRQILTAGELGLVPEYRPSPSWYRSFAAREEETHEAVQCAFAGAMGGVPDDVTVRSLAAPGLPGPVLVGVAHREEDLLVVGASARRWWCRNSVGRYCAARVGCPVRVVPPHELARAIEGRHRPWRQRTFDDLLAGNPPV
ncbi:hypothetical protein BOG92_000280 [Streptomyces sp. WAC00263]|nr:hypothetical protein BOG92_000280 [Streptomyces sp. WAC00263]